MKKLTKLIAAFAVVLSASVSAFAYELPENWNFSIGVDAAYYPLSAKVPGKSEDHFAALTGAYSGLEGRVTGSASYTIATPLGSSWLLKDANLVLGGDLELSPVSIKPCVSATFTPLPFLVFSAGAQAGTGWDLAGLKGMAVEAIPEEDYTDLTPFKDYFLKWWAQGTFQFDTGAIWSGDWTHVVMQYTYQVYYEYLTGADDQQAWEWQCSGNKVNGLKNYQCGILAYQMPLVLYRAGVMIEADGYYSSDAYANPYYNGDFMSVSISPLLQFKFNDHNTLAVLFGFSSRRGYENDLNDYNYPEYTAGIFSSREWYFNRVAFSYTYTF